MSSDFSPERARELLDDFYTECDEQLGVLRDLLTGLEAGARGNAPAALEPLFRNMHSLKGNAAIVGLREAEELAHAAEDFLRGLTRASLRLSEPGVDALLQAVHRLEQIIGAHRRQGAIPPVTDLVNQLKLLAGSAPSPTPSPTIATGPNAGGYRVVFSPSRELDARGININSTRTRLGEIGRIISSKPIIAGGVMTFEFIVEFTAPPDSTEWLADGLTVSAQTAAPEPTPASPSTSPFAPTTDSAATDDAGSSLFIAPSHIVRVDLSRLDDLLRIAGELVIHRSRLDDRLNQGLTDPAALKEVNLALTRSLRELREAITRVRLVPIAEVFARLPFVVRDLARNSDKKARLLIEGKHTEIDKYLVERLKEPLLHLVRNAFSHGLESTPERLAAGKPAEGTIVLSAVAEGGFVLVKIRDDGRGLQPSRILERARALNLPVPEIVDEKSLLDLLCAPGFSTREEADLTSGRGVGMSVVREVVQTLGGSLSLQTTPSAGTQFTLRLPLTLSIVETILVSISGHTCALPQNVIQEIVEVADADIRTINRTLVMPYRDAVLPVVRLSGLFAATDTRALPIKPVLVIRSEQGFAGLIADRVIGQREVVVRPMEDPLIQARGIAGATELGDGRPVLILDALALLEGAVRPLSAAASLPSHP